MLTMDAWLLSEGGGSLCISPLRLDGNMRFGISRIIQSGSMLLCIAQWQAIVTFCEERC